MTPSTGVTPSSVPSVPSVRRRWWMLAACMWSAGVSQGFGRFSYPVLLPLLRGRLIRTYSGAGVVGALNVGAYLVGILLVMVVSRRVPAHRIMIAGLTLSTAALAVMASAGGIAQLGVGMAFAGLGGAGVWVPATGVATALFPPARKGMAAGLVGGGVATCMLLSGQLAKVAGPWWGPDGWRAVWWLTAAAGAAALLYQVVVLHPPVASAGHADRPGRWGIGTMPRGWAVTGAYVAFGFAYIVIITYMVVALVEAGFEPGWAADTFSLLSVANLAGATLLGPWSDRVGRRVALAAMFGAATLAGLLLISGQGGLVRLGVVLFGTTFGGAPAVIAAYVGDHTPPRAFPAVFGAVTVGFALAQAIGPVTGGWLRDVSGGFVWVMLMAAAVFALGALLCMFLAPGHQGRDGADPAPGQAPSASRSGRL